MKNTFLFLLLFTLSCSFPYKEEIEIPIGSRKLLVHSVLQPDSLLTLMLDLNQPLNSSRALTSVEMDVLSNSSITLNIDNIVFDSLKRVPTTHLDFNWMVNYGTNKKIFFQGSRPVPYITNRVYELRVENEIFGSVHAFSEFATKVDISNVISETKLNKFVFETPFGTLDSLWENELSMTVFDNDEPKYLLLAFVGLQFAELISIAQFNVNISEQPSFANGLYDPERLDIFKKWPYSTLAFRSDLLPKKDNNLRVLYSSRVLSEFDPPSEEHKYADLFLIYTITKDYFDFLEKSSMQHLLYDIPFTEIVPLPSNIINGLGFFGSAAPSLAYPLSAAGQAYLNDTSDTNLFD